MKPRELQLVVDVGNTETVLGVVARDLGVLDHWRVTTLGARTADEYEFLVGGLLARGGYERRELIRTVIGSVVPSVTPTLKAMLERVGDGPVIEVTASSKLPIRLRVDEPRTVGADRVVNTLAARELFSRDTIVVDLGTATTYDCITAEGDFVGGVIAPGISAGLDWLTRRAAKLPEVGLQPPERVIGTRTEVCMQSGVFHGVVDAIEQMLQRIRSEWQRPDALVVATGGFATVVAPYTPSVQQIEPFLTLQGLALAGDYLAQVR